MRVTPCNIWICAEISFKNPCKVQVWCLSVSVSCRKSVSFFKLQCTTGVFFFTSCKGQILTVKSHSYLIRYLIITLNPWAVDHPRAWVMPLALDYQSFIPWQQYKAISWQLRPITLSILCLLVPCNGFSLTCTVLSLTGSFISSYARVLVMCISCTHKVSVSRLVAQIKHYL